VDAGWPTLSGVRPRLAGISCASSDACTALDSDGAVRVWDGRDWSAAVHVGSRSSYSFDQLLTAIDCPTAAWCQAVSAQDAYVWGG
jgi:hypothetical protein